VHDQVNTPHGCPRYPADLYSYWQVEATRDFYNENSWKNTKKCQIKTKFINND
jgi:hypothetical protein